MTPVQNRVGRADELTIVWAVQASQHGNKMSTFWPAKESERPRFTDRYSTDSEACLVERYRACVGGTDLDVDAG